MTTILSASINTVAEATAFITELYINGESYHPEDDAHQIEWNTCAAPTFEEAEQLNKLFEDIYNLNGNNGNHATCEFDPCTVLMDLHEEKAREVKIFLYKDTSGRGYINKMNGNQILKTMPDVDMELRNFIDDSREGDRHEATNFTLTAL